MDECFNKCYLSNELHLAKPDPEIYKAVLADCGADAAECLYLDDNLANVEAACKLGWNASVSSSPEQTIDILTRFEQTGLY